jgi:AraC-like DNA-binding protein
MRMVAADPTLASWVTAFVERDERLELEVVRLLPEPRASLQWMLADRYWIKADQPGSVWQQLPASGMWAPRVERYFGCAHRHIRAFAIALTPAAWHSILPGSMCTNMVLDLERAAPRVASILRPLALEDFESWQARVQPQLRAYFQNCVPTLPFERALDASLSALAADTGIAEIAQLLAVSERHYRRLFIDRFGLSPKKFQSLQRVDRMLRQLREQAWEQDQFELPLSFSDQAHRIREFKRIVGLTPNAYIKAKRQGNRTLRSLPTKQVAPPDFSA